MLRTKIKPRPNANRVKTGPRGKSRETHVSNLGN